VGISLKGLSPRLARRRSFRHVERGHEPRMTGSLSPPAERAEGTTLLRAPARLRHAGTRGGVTPPWLVRGHQQSRADGIHFTPTIPGGVAQVIVMTFVTVTSPRAAIPRATARNSSPIVPSDAIQMHEASGNSAEVVNFPKITRHPKNANRQVKLTRTARTRSSGRARSRSAPGFPAESPVDVDFGGRG